MKKKFGSKIQLPVNYMQNSLAEMRNEQSGNNDNNQNLSVEENQSVAVITNEEVQEKITDVSSPTPKVSNSKKEIKEEKIVSRREDIYDNNDTKGKKEAIDFFSKFHSTNQTQTRIDVELLKEYKLISTLAGGSIFNAVNNILKQWLIDNESEIKKAKRNGHF